MLFVASTIPPTMPTSGLSIVGLMTENEAYWLCSSIATDCTVITLELTAVTVKLIFAAATPIGSTTALLSILLLSAIYLNYTISFFAGSPKSPSFQTL